MMEFDLTFLGQVRSNIENEESYTKIQLLRFIKVEPSSLTLLQKFQHNFL